MSVARGIYFTRSRPYEKNDLAAIDSRNNHVVRRYEFQQHDTDLEKQAPHKLRDLVNDQMNYLMPTIKSTGYGSGKDR